MKSSNSLKYLVTIFFVGGIGTIVFSVFSNPPERLPVDSENQHSIDDDHSAPPQGPGQNIPPVTEGESLAKDVAEILAVEACYESQACDYPQTDPRAYEFAVGQDLRKRTLDFLTKNKNLENRQSDLQLLARKVIAVGDGHVQAAALEIFAELPPSAENLNAITQALDTVSDPLIMEKSMVELQRYLGTPEEPQVHAFIQASIVSGAHFSGQAASKEVLPFINEQSYDRYMRAYDQMAKPSESAKRLKQALTEFERIRTGA